MRRSTAAVVAVLALAAVLAGCTSPQKQRPDAAALTADAVNFRNGLALLREGKVDEAIQLIKSAMAANPNDPGVWNALGLALLAGAGVGVATGGVSRAIRSSSFWIASVIFFLRNCSTSGFQSGLRCCS